MYMYLQLITITITIQEVMLTISAEQHFKQQGIVTLVFLYKITLELIKYIFAVTL